MKQSTHFLDFSSLLEYLVLFWRTFQSLRHSQMMVDRLRACIIANYYGSASQQRFVKVYTLVSIKNCNIMSGKAY